MSNVKGETWEDIWEEFVTKKVVLKKISSSEGDTGIYLSRPSQPMIRFFQAKYCGQFGEYTLKHLCIKRCEAGDIVCLKCRRMKYDERR